MNLQPVRRHTVADDVFEQLVAEVSGLAPGESLPSERRLTEVLGVSRPVVREALQRLSHAGLVEVRQGDATTVRDFRRDGGLDLLARLLVPARGLDVAVARSIVEARHLVGPTVAELAASRPDIDDAAVRLTQLAAALRATTDPVTRQRLALEFWDVVIDAADSLVFRLMFNSLRAAYEPMLDALASLIDGADQPERYDALAAALADRDPARARAAAEDLLGPATTALLSALDDLDAPGPGAPAPAGADRDGQEDA
ncbi:FadR family transcriptional regulator [Nocardioides sp. HDW12B]|uniref:FadR/GntR family transcriptional regulator n=1 Tax=Nocardioides sp. HDW12B TaxID=2714939 RepID=UPI001407B880|nr:GntR family transcriptional regulator [Nocardioides sp. HDW12B]QIK65005.1 FadR family transcriptional regulator [Nocardioides sp. HDW12B]